MKYLPQNNNGRRKFLKNSVKAGLVTSFLMPSVNSLGQLLPSTAPKTPSGVSNPLKILILGGTGFLGPQLVASALNRGHSVTIFTRGITKPTTHIDVFKHVEHLIGDRENNLEALKGRTWDVVIDNSGYRVEWTRDSVQLLHDKVDLYVYTSSTGVYYPYVSSNIKEGTRLNFEIPEGVDNVEAMEYGYGVMKAKSELEAIHAFGERRTIIVRPTYMMGPGDRTDRFTYWPIRIEKGGEILVPGKAEDPVQYIDVRDVAKWMIQLIEKNNTGTYNAVGPASFTGMHAFIYGVHAAFNAAISFVMIPDYDFLKKFNVLDAIPWIMPTGNNFGSARVNKQLAIQNGLTYTPLATSCRDIYDWWYSDVIREDHRELLLTGSGSLMTREKEIIADWKATC